MVRSPPKSSHTWLPLATPPFAAPRPSANALFFAVFSLTVALAAPVLSQYFPGHTRWLLETFAFRDFLAHGRFRHLSFAVALHTVTFAPYLLTSERTSFVLFLINLFSVPYLSYAYNSTVDQCLVSSKHAFSE